MSSPVRVGETNFSHQPRSTHRSLLPGVLFAGLEETRLFFRQYGLTLQCCDAFVLVHEVWHDLFK